MEAMIAEVDAGASSSKRTICGFASADGVRGTGNYPSKGEIGEKAAVVQ